MKYAAAIAVFTTLASAQSACDSVAAQIPTCAVSCLESAGSQAGCTATNDYSCQCDSASQSAIQSAARDCVLSNCGSSAIGVVSSASAVCDCAATAAQYDSNIPTSVEASTSTEPSTYSETTSTEMPSSDEEDGQPYDLITSETAPTYPGSAPTTYPAATGSNPSSGYGIVATTSIYPPISSDNAAKVVRGIEGVFGILMGAMILF